MLQLLRIRSDKGSNITQNFSCYHRVGEIFRTAFIKLPHYIDCVNCYTLVVLIRLYSLLLLFSSFSLLFRTVFSSFFLLFTAHYCRSQVTDTVTVCSLTVELVLGLIAIPKQYNIGFTINSQFLGFDFSPKLFESFNCFYSDFSADII